jgi:GxxExxY protein
MDTDKNKFDESAYGEYIGAAFEVSNTLGAGFLEKVYERALLRELAGRGVQAVPEVDFNASITCEHRARQRACRSISRGRK